VAEAAAAVEGGGGGGGGPSKKRRRSGSSDGAQPEEEGMGAGGGEEGAGESSGAAAPTTWVATALCPLSISLLGVSASQEVVLSVRLLQGDSPVEGERRKGPATHAATECAQMLEAALSEGPLPPTFLPSLLRRCEDAVR
jgi:hypothetical protein